MLGEAGLRCHVCHAALEFLAHPAESYGPVLLTEEALTGTTVRTLASRLAAQPAWSNLPVTILTSRYTATPNTGPGPPDLATALGSRRSVIFLERPVRVATLVSVMRSAVLARQRQYELRDQLVARQQAEDHAHMLTGEMKHRIKNSLALVGAMASQTFRPSRPLEDSLAAFSARLKSMALAQDVLTEANGDGVSLDHLVGRALDPYRQPDAPGRIAIAGPGVWITGRRSTSLTMALHELATNALKYGALSTDAGRVTVAWRVEPTPAPPQLHIEWREHGGPPVHPPTQRGFGSRLVERGLAMELGGTATIAFPPEGVTCTITAPLDAEA